MTNHANASSWVTQRIGRDIDSNQSKRKVIHSRDVRFDEQLRGTEDRILTTEEENPPGPVMFEKEYSESGCEELPADENDVHQDPTFRTNNHCTLRRSTRVTGKPDRFGALGELSCCQ